ncbi:Phosphomethylpyrimidine kinase-domain-containing protein [Infundibulicybe gibba]|nr:Phosphomethylpyrimidine kinase-domain-containing protein [Infundibulicybe gibba]
MGPCVLTIAGSDSGGGAGIQGDLKTIIAHHCYGATAITALTAQNTAGVQAIHPCPPEFVAQQIHSVVTDLEVQAIKTGMLHSAPVVQATVGALLARYGAADQIPPLVVDPVCVSTSGHTLLDPSAVSTLLKELIPLAKVITPNAPEAALLLSRETPIIHLADMIDAARDLATRSTRPVLLKGGHIPSTTMEDVRHVTEEHPQISVVRYGLAEEGILILKNLERTAPVAVDVLHEPDHVTIFVRPWLNALSTHGTGCTLSAALACELARGLNLRQGTERAIIYTYCAIQTASPIGQGRNGPLNHSHALSTRCIPLRSPEDPHPFVRLLVRDTREMWDAYTQHEFVRQVGAGTLPRAAFLYFIKQDYHYLKYYSRAYGLLAAKSTTTPALSGAARTILTITNEMQSHRALCHTFGVASSELENAEEGPATMAYGGYLIDIGVQDDAITLIIALLACLLGYGEVGLQLAAFSSSASSGMEEGLTGTPNPYQRWIEEYAGEAFQTAVREGLGTADRMCVSEDPPSPRRMKRWREIWARCVRLEKEFWDAAMDAVGNRSGGERE